MQGHGHGGLPLWLASPRVLAIREAGTQYAPASPSPLVELALEQGDEHEVEGKEEGEEEG